MSTLVIVTPNGYFSDADHARGRPATHACEIGSKRTLCGRRATGWMVQNIDAYDGLIDGVEMVSCATCLRIINERTKT